MSFLGKVLNVKTVNKQAKSRYERVLAVCDTISKEVATLERIKSV